MTIAISTAKITEFLLRDYVFPDGIRRARIMDTALAGFAAVIGPKGPVFIVRRRVGGKRRDETIGRHQAPGAGPDRGGTWTVARARSEALRKLGAMAAGEDPSRKRAVAKAAVGPTLREGLAIHISNMRKMRRSQASIDTVEREVARYLGKLLDRPISSIDGPELSALHESIKAGAKVRANSNPLNPKGAPVANRVIAHVSSIWASVNRSVSGKLGPWNPAKAVVRDLLLSKREVLADIPDWCARVATMTNPVGRDGLMLALFTGLRSEDVRTIRHEHVDVAARTLLLPDPKGGTARAFTIPLSATSLEILTRRRVDNVARFGFVGGDGGYVFPAVDNDNEIIPISDLRQQVHGHDGHTRFPREDVHTLRRTYESVGSDDGVSELDLHVLTNHSYGNKNVNASYIKQHIDHLRRCTERIEAGLLARMARRAT